MSLGYHLIQLNYLKFFSLFFKSNNFENSLIELKKLAKIFAFSCPIYRIPMEKINLSSKIDFDFVNSFF